MSSSTPPTSDFSRAAGVLEERFEEIFDAYEERLRETRNLLLVGGGATRESLKAQARSILGRAAEALRGEEASVSSIEEEVYQNIEAAKSPLIQHPDESFRAGLELCKAALGVVARELDLSGHSHEDIFRLSLVVQESVLDHVARVAMVSYVDYLLAKINEVQVEERRRFSRELHDRVAHSMAMVNQHLELREAFRQKNPEQAEKKIKQAGESAREALRIARDLSMELRRSSSGESLALSLDNLMRASIPPGVEFEVSFDGDEDLLPDYVRDQLYMVLREGIRNAITHSGCGHISVKIEVAPGEVVASVSDDGDGFEADGEQDGVGLRSMRERTALVGGSFELTSSPESGTRAGVRIPLNGKRRWT